METMKILLYEGVIAAAFFGFGYFVKYNIVTRLVAITLIMGNIAMFLLEVDYSNIALSDVGFFESNYQYIGLATLLITLISSILGWKQAVKTKLLQETLHTIH